MANIARRARATELDHILIKGAREHNLRGIDVKIPKKQLVVLTGIHTVNLWLFDAAALLATIPLAILSWRLIERPIMRRARQTQGSAPRH